jgi:hypothetical protein
MIPTQRTRHTTHTFYTAHCCHGHTLMFVSLLASSSFFPCHGRPLRYQCSNSFFVPFFSCFIPHERLFLLCGGKGAILRNHYHIGERQIFYHCSNILLGCGTLLHSWSSKASERLRCRGAMVEKLGEQTKRRSCIVGLSHVHMAVRSRRIEAVRQQFCIICYVTTVYT